MCIICIIDLCNKTYHRASKCGLSSVVCVMASALHDFEFAFFNAIYDPMFTIDSPAPPSTKISGERLGFSDSVKRLAFDITNKL